MVEEHSRAKLLTLGQLGSRENRKKAREKGTGQDYQGACPHGLPPPVSLHPLTAHSAKEFIHGSVHWQGWCPQDSGTFEAKPYFINTTISL